MAKQQGCWAEKVTIVPQRHSSLPAFSASKDIGAVTIHYGLSMACFLVTAGSYNSFYRFSKILKAAQMVLRQNLPFLLLIPSTFCC